MSQAVLWGIKNGSRATKILMDVFFTIPLHLAKKKIFFLTPPPSKAAPPGGCRKKKKFRQMKRNAKKIIHENFGGPTAIFNTPEYSLRHKSPN